MTGKTLEPIEQRKQAECREEKGYRKLNRMVQQSCRKDREAHVDRIREEWNNTQTIMRLAHYTRKLSRSPKTSNRGCVISRTRNRHLGSTRNPKKMENAMWTTIPGRYDRGLWGCIANHSDKGWKLEILIDKIREAIPYDEETQSFGMQWYRGRVNTSTWWKWRQSTPQIVQLGMASEKVACEVVQISNNSPRTIEP